MTRLILVALCVLLVVAALAGMRRGWLNRADRQSGLPARPTVPAQLGPASLTSTGLYVGTAYASSWQDRVVHDGLGARADATAYLHPEGLLIDRRGTTPVFVPRPQWVGARLAPGLAGKVVGAGGLLVLQWRLGDAVLDTGFRADDKTTYPEWVQAINGRVAA
jgi:hypothetical protein